MSVVFIYLKQFCILTNKYQTKVGRKMGDEEAE